MYDSVESILGRKGREVWSVSPEATVYDAIAMMADKGVGAILVMSKATLVGIISERDYARKIILQGRSSIGTKVGEIMTKTLVTVTPDMRVEQCMRIMTEHHIRHLPVLENDHVTGLISIRDLVNAILSDQAHTIDQLHAYIGGSYPD